MRELVIISGKGGTGKTSLTAAFAALAAQTSNSILCDADVDAADLHLLMQPQVRQRTDFMGGSKAVINPDLCTGCGTCRNLCRFGAITEAFAVDPIRCEGCGVCVDFCPVSTIDFPVQRCGEWYISDTRFGPMVHARLGIAEENSGKLVSLVRKETRQLAEEGGCDLILTDGPPGIGCPVIAAIGGATALIIVVEPTVSGIHDMERVLDLAAHFRVPGMVCVNKFDLNVEMTETIEALAARRNVTLLGRVPFDPVFTRSMVAGTTLFEYGEETPTHQTVRQIWEKIINSPSMNPLGIVDFKATIQ
jgi:MinD superfamily P-loop ATPase